MFAITDVSLRDIFEIIKEFEYFPYQFYVRKGSKNVPTDGYFYISKQLEKCMMRFNICIGPVSTQMTNTRKINSSDMSRQNIPNSQVCSLDNIESKRIKVDKRESRVCYTDDN